MRLQTQAEPAFPNIQAPSFEWDDDGNLVNGHELDAFIVLLRQHAGDDIASRMLANLQQQCIEQQKVIRQILAGVQHEITAMKTEMDDLKKDFQKAISDLQKQITDLDTARQADKAQYQTVVTEWQNKYNQAMLEKYELEAVKDAIEGTLALQQGVQGPPEGTVMLTIALTEYKARIKAIETKILALHLTAPPPPPQPPQQPPSMPEQQPVVMLISPSAPESEDMDQT